jgi:REP element-mobilizing transposase RayT
MLVGTLALQEEAMTTDPKKEPGFIRKHPAHPVPVRRHNTPVILHVSVCTNPRRDILAAMEVHAALRQVWTKADHWCVGYYVIMSDHLHLFCAPARWDCVTVKDWATFWKRQVVRRLPFLKGCWESDCWDTQMRDQEHYIQKLEYVQNNPVRKGLVSQPEDWPYQGHMAELIWI